MSDIRFDHEKLDVYQVSLQFVAWAFELCARIKGNQRFAREHLLQASQSITQNIAEGNGKRSRLDRSRYFEISRGSALECASILDVLRVCRTFSPSELEPGKEMLYRIVSMLSRMTDRPDRVCETEEGYEPV